MTTTVQISETPKCRSDATTREECPRPVACNLHNDGEMRRAALQAERARP
jgi:hypothetical protein